MTQRQAERLAEDISNYKGQWVLVRGSKVVAAAPSFAKAIEKVPRKDRSKVRAQFCPKEDYTGSSFSAL